MLKLFSKLIILSFFTGLIYGYFSTVPNFQDAIGTSRTNVVHVLWPKGALPVDVIELFQSEYKVKVHITEYSNDEEALSLLEKSQHWDVALVNNYLVPGLNKNNRLSPITELSPDIIDSVGADFLSLPSDPDMSFSLPVTWSLYGFVYDKSKTGKALHSWSDVFDSRFKKHLAISRDTHSILKSLIEHKNHSLASAVVKLAADTFSLDTIHTGNYAHIYEKLNSGEVWIAQVSETQARELRKAKKDLTFFVPNEGTAILIQTIVLPLKQERSFRTNDLVSFLIQKDVASTISEMTTTASAHALLESSSGIRKAELKKIEVLRDMEHATSYFKSVIEKKSARSPSSL